MDSVVEKIIYKIPALRELIPPLRCQHLSAQLAEAGTTWAQSFGILSKDYRLIPYSHFSFSYSHFLLACCSRKKDKLWSQGDLCSNLDSITECATWASYLNSPNLSFLVSELPTGRVDIKVYVR